MVAGAAPDLTLRGPAYEWALWSTTVRLAVANPHHLPAARRLVDRELAAVEQASSRFRADSELRRLAHRGGRPTRVSAVFLEMLDAALAAARLTGGAGDPPRRAARAARGDHPAVPDVRRRPARHPGVRRPPPGGWAVGLVL